MTTKDGFHYSDKYLVSHLSQDAKQLNDDSPAALAGRVVLLRPYGSLLFGHIQDSQGRIQFALHKRILGSEVFKQYLKNVSLGDFIGVTGVMTTTSTGEHTLNVESMELLSRAHINMPDKHLGVTHAETRQRRRYLDLLYNEETRKRFQLRSYLLKEIRNFLDTNGFQEVETPVLQPAASGASAKPFSTHHNALHQDLFLRIAPETYLKRLLVGGLDKVYELGKNFRNEGMDSSHLQEFTMLEWYVAYWDYQDNMHFIQKMVQTILTNALGTSIINYAGQAIDFGGKWPVLDYRQTLKEQTGLDLTKLRDFKSLSQAIINNHLADINIEQAKSYASLVDLLYKKTVRPTLLQPTFLVNHPAELVPLARRNDKDPSVLDMFQVVVNGWEIVKAYSELIDPQEQRLRFEEQAQMLAKGDQEAMMTDNDFLEAMDYGMPPMSGLGFGIDRFVALVTNSPTVRDVVLFPQMKDVSDVHIDETNLSSSSPSNTKKTTPELNF